MGGRCDQLGTVGRHLVPGPVSTPVRGMGIVTLEIALDTPTHRAELHTHASTPSILLL